MHTYMHRKMKTQCFFQHGAVQVPQELFYTASTSNVIAGQLGVFGWKPSILDDYLAGMAFHKHLFTLQFYEVVCKYVIMYPCKLRVLDGATRSWI